MTIVDDVYARRLNLCKGFGKIEPVTLSEFSGGAREYVMQEPKKKRKFQPRGTGSATEM